MQVRTARIRVRRKNIEPAQQVMRLSERDSRAVAEAVLNPQLPNEVMRKAAERYKARTRP